MNRLSGMPRAICAPSPGTTRDILAAPIRIGRGEAILLDSAGVDDSPDEILAQARELTLATAEQVDLVCFVVDAAAALVSIGATLSPWASPGAVCRSPSWRPTSAICFRATGAPARWRACLRCTSAPWWPPARSKTAESTTFALAARRRARVDRHYDAREAVLISERQRIAITEAADALHRATETASEVI